MTLLGFKTRQLPYSLCKISSKYDFKLASYIYMIHNETLLHKNYIKIIDLPSFLIQVPDNPSVPSGLEVKQASQISAEGLFTRVQRIHVHSSSDFWAMCSLEHDPLPYAQPIRLFLAGSLLWNKRTMLVFCDVPSTNCLTPLCAGRHGAREQAAHRVMPPIRAWTACHCSSLIFPFFTSRVNLSRCCRSNTNKNI